MIFCADKYQELIRPSAAAPGLSNSDLWIKAAVVVLASIAGLTKFIDRVIVWLEIKQLILTFSRLLKKSNCFWLHMRSAILELYSAVSLECCNFIVVNSFVYGLNIGHMRILLFPNASACTFWAH